MMVGPNWDEVPEEWWRLHNVQLQDLYSSPNIAWVMRPRRMRWSRHVARLGTRQVHTGFWWGNLKQRERLEDLSVDGRIISKCEEIEWGCELDRAGSR